MLRVLDVKRAKLVEYLYLMIQIFSHRLTKTHKVFTHKFILVILHKIYILYENLNFLKYLVNSHPDFRLLQPSSTVLLRHTIRIPALLILLYVQIDNIEIYNKKVSFLYYNENARIYTASKFCKKNSQVENE